MSENMPVRTYDAYIDENEWWLPSYDMNALFYKDKKSNKELEYIYIFDNLENDEAWKIRKVITYKNEIYFFSRHAYQVWILDMKSHHLKSLIYKKADNQQEVINIADIFVIDNEVWIFQSTLEKDIVIFDLDEKKLIKELCYKNEKENLLLKSPITRASIKNKKIYIATREKENIYLCEIDCVSKKIISIKLSNAKYVSCLGTSDKYIWILMENIENEFVLEAYDYDLKNKVDSIVLERCGNMKDIRLPYVQMISFKQSLILIPAIQKNIIVINIDTKEKNILKCSEKVIYNENQNFEFSESRIVKNNLYLISFKKSEIFKLNLLNLKIEKMNMHCEIEEWAKAYNNSKISLLKEDICIKIDEFFKLLRTNYKDNNKEKENEGKVIYNYFL